MACSKRGDGESCSYTNTSKNRQVGYGASRTTEAQNRLQKLEQMVTTLMHADKDGMKNGMAHSANGSVDERLKDLFLGPHSSKSSRSSVRGHLDVHGPEIKYLGATNWETILENVRCASCDNVPKSLMGVRYTIYKATLYLTNTAAKKRMMMSFSLHVPALTLRSIQLGH